MEEEKNAGKPTTPGAAGAGAGGFKESFGRSFDPPVSWVRPVALARTQFLLRYPPIGRRTIQLRNILTLLEAPIDPLYI